MARRRKNKQQDDTLVDIVEVRDQAQDFFERNQNIILGVVFGLVLIVGGIFAYNNFVKKPKQLEAIDQIRQAQMQFEQDSFALALTNPGGGYGGFLEIIDKYGGTKTGNTAKYYAGISYLNLGDFDNAISYLEDFSPSGELLPIMKYGSLGDAYSEKEDFGKAKSNYEKAISTGDNEILTAYFLKKLGLLHEHEGNADKALAMYKQIVSDFPNSTSAQEIEKYIYRIEEK